MGTAVPGKMVPMLTLIWTVWWCANAVSAFVVRPSRSSSLVDLSSTSAGQGGGIFYDGPEYQSVGESQTFDSPSSVPFFASRSKPGVQNKDVVIIGGGLAGLSAALYLSQLDPDRHITILEREVQNDNDTKSTVASFAAAGMLAPQSERLPKGPLLDLCIASRRLYPDFVDLVETLAQDPEGHDNLWKSDDDRPWSVGYMASGGFLAPAFAGDSVATWAPPDDSGSAIWLDAVQVRELEPNLHPDVVGGWWFPEDASVDARRLTCSLRAACVATGVQLQVGAEVTSLDLVDGHCKGLWLASGKYLKTKSVLVANGAWMRNLLPVPIEPHKGQSISLRMPANEPALLKRVLFAQDTYIVPKADGRIVVGATVEAGSYDPNVTPAGIMHILTHAMQLVPGLGDLPLEETWVGLRPTTPDKGPILGKTPWDNLFLAGGYWRNGVLLAPKTGQLLASLLSGQPLNASDEAFLDAFAWDRFTSPERSAAVMANTRYAASMHPIHRRRSGSGVAAAVGTELGSYSTARSASEERRQDRIALFENTGDDSLERAAELGRSDAVSYVFEDTPVNMKKEPSAVERAEQERRPSLPATSSLAEVPFFSKVEKVAESASSSGISTGPHMDSLPPLAAAKYEGSADALTVHSQADDEDSSDLSSVYERIQQNKQSNVEMGEVEPYDRVDPGFRIYHVDSETGEEREVPPFTTPDEMRRIVEKDKASTEAVAAFAPVSTLEGMMKMMERAQVSEAVVVSDEKGDSIFDGYKAIEEANAGISPEDSAKAMRDARVQNRGISEPLDLDTDSFPSFQRDSSAEESFFQGDSSAKESEDSDLADIYNRIRQNKAPSVEMGDAPKEERADPGYRIYYVDPDSGESHEVPPFTSPEDMVRMVAESKLRTNGHVPEESPQEPPLMDSAPNGESKEYSEKTYDGYQDIQQANARGTREEELEAMRAARRQNRLGSDEIDPSKIGAQRDTSN